VPERFWHPCKSAASVPEAFRQSCKPADTLPEVFRRPGKRADKVPNGAPGPINTAAVMRPHRARQIAISEMLLKLFFRRAAPLLLLLIALTAHAQTGTIRGTLLDAASGQALPFANVLLRRAADSTVATGAQGSEAGGFVLGPVPPGQYVLQASAVGYRTGRRALTLSTAAPALDLGALRLRAVAAQLADVVVTAERPVLSQTPDKQVIDVSKDLTATGGTALDVLQNVPSVSVDQTGAVSLRGSSGVTVFIDGKPTTTTLDQVPASAIQSIEVITNPSARYDAAGAGGILNLVLKKERRAGLNGQAALNAGTGDKASTALSLNYRRGKVNVFGSYDFRRDRRRLSGTLDQATSYRDTTLVQQQSRRAVSVQQSHVLRLGLDYALGPGQTLTLAVQPRFNPLTVSEELNSRQVNASHGDRPVGSGTSQRRNATTGTYRSADVTADYRRAWAADQTQLAGRELTASVIYTPGLAETAVASDNFFPLDNSRVGQQQLTSNRSTAATGQVDYSHPLSERSHFEVGLRAAYLRYDLTYRLSRQPALAFDPSNEFVYHQLVPAVYGQYAGARDKFTYQLGLRAEQTRIRGEQVSTGQTTPQRYFDLFPSATLAYELPRERRVQLSYSRRVQRPDAEELNPFTDRSDPLNLVTGNPNLLPEYTHALELGGQQSWDGGRSLGATAFYRLETNTAQRFRLVFLDPLTGQLATNSLRQNLGQETSYGLELVGASPLTGFWKLNGTASTFRRLIVGAAADGTPINTSSQVFSARLNNNFALSKKLGVQLALNYRSPVNTAQGTRYANFNVDLAARRTLLSADRGTFTLRVSDVFNTLRFDADAFGPGLSTQSRLKRESRIVFLGFAYRFGRDGEGAKTKRREERDDAGGGFE